MSKPSVAQAGNGDAKAAAEAAEETVPANTPASSRPATPRHILIADDEAPIRSLLRDFLEGEGFQVSEAQTGQQVMKALAEGGYDLIMMDIRMPELDGLAVLKEMHTKKVDVPIIVMTAHNSANIANKAVQLGVNAYITQPVQLHEVHVT